METQPNQSNKPKPVPLRHCPCPGASAVCNLWAVCWFGSPDLQAAGCRAPQFECSRQERFSLSNVTFSCCSLSPAWLDPHAHGKPCIFFLSCLELYLFEAVGSLGWAMRSRGSACTTVLIQKTRTGFVAAHWCVRLLCAFLHKVAPWLHLWWTRFLCSGKCLGAFG